MSFYLRGRVVSGHRRGGTQLGFPTANVELNASVVESLKPHINGVFYGWGVVERDSVLRSAGSHPDADTAFDRAIPVVFSVGFNPHFKDTALTVEVYFVHRFSKDFYGGCIRVLSLGRLRDQKAYTTLDALLVDIQGDVSKGQELLAGTDGLRAKSDVFLDTSRVGAAGHPGAAGPVPFFCAFEQSKL